MTYSFFAVLIFTCSVAGATAINAPRQGPTLTTSVEGLYPPPTSTDSAVLDGYQDALRKCGPDVDAATQSALQQYNVEIIGQVPGTKNVTDANDSKFIAWTVTHSDLNQVKLLCETARRAFENLPFTRELSTSPSATSGQISSSQSSTVAHQDDPSIPPEQPPHLPPPP
ncbi:hypothetical protein C8R43DRAFT_962839 [Mycena crocata]|nr:hypothetical protein C8R43DRAFT_962839 [Mycena crocata]